MKMTVYFDGAFWSALIEYMDRKEYKAFRYIFGTEPKDEEVQEFIRCKLDKLLNQYTHINTHTDVSEQKVSKKNPKRLQREINKAKNRPIVSTKAQLAMQEIHDSIKKERKHCRKKQRDEEKQLKYQLKKEKRRQKKKGH